MTETLDQRLRALAVETAALARELGHAELAETVDTQVSRSDSNEVSVVVVGEKKRGKSSLINALVGIRDLLPVDADVATNCFLTLGYGSAEQVVAHDAQSPEGIEIDRGRIAEFASVEGNRDPDDEDLPLHEGVTAVEIRLDHPLLSQGLVLVDTPGVGGLEAGHTEITLATLRRADALLFVVDPDSPLKAPELRFLERATARIATVIFVMTKIDLYPGWERILADNRELIAAHAPSFMERPWAAVSSELRLEGADERSGFPELERLLREEILDRADVLQHSNALQSAASALDRMARAEELRIRSATGDPALVDELESKQDLLRRLTEANASWRQRSAEELRRLDAELQRSVQRRVRELRRHAEDRIDAAAPGFQEALKRDTPAELQAIWIEMATSLQQAVAALMLSLAGEFEEQGIDPVTFDLDYPEALAAVPTISHSASAETIADNLPAALMGFGGASVGATALGAVGIAFPPLLVAGAGLALAHFIFGERTERAERQRTQRELRVWLGRVTEDAAFEMTGKLRETLAGVPDAVEEFFSGRLEARRVALEGEVAACKQHVRADQTERARVHADAEARLRRINEVAGAAAELFGSIEKRPVAAIASEGS
jgi:GTPase SAR1 family protein